MAITHHHVDPSLDSDNTGTGIGDPWGDLEYLLETGTPGSDGNQINIKSGVDELLAAPLQTALAAGAFSPSVGNPLIFRGYTAIENDGGIGGISGQDSVSVFGGAAVNHVFFIETELHSSGANSVIDLNDHCGLIRCHVHGSDTHIVQLDTNGYVKMCYVHDGGGYGILGASGLHVENSWIEDYGAGLFGASMSAGGIIRRNVFVVPSTSYGVVTAYGTVIDNNNFFCVGGTGAAILGTGTRQPTQITNNLFEGFSGAGGRGIDMSATDSSLVVIGGNAGYNCTTPYAAADPQIFDLGDNETLSASPFVDAANGDFTPVDTGNVKEGALPQIIGGGLV